MTIKLQKPDITELKPRITVFGVGGGGGNAVNNMINAGMQGVEFVVANTDAQALTTSNAERLVQLGVAVTEGLGAGSQPEVGRAAAEECIDEILDHLNGTHMCFVTAGMGGGTGTGAAPVVAQAARDKGILTVGVVTKPFHFEGQRRMRLAEAGIEELQKCVDTLIVIPNQNLFRIANDKTTFADAFAMADQVLYSGVACITDLMVKEGLINLDFADVRSVMREMGRAMMGTGEASGEGRAMAAAEAAIANPLLDETTMKGAQGLLISITGGRDMTLFEVDEAATRIREEVDADANIILGATFDEELEGLIRVSVVATGIDRIESAAEQRPMATSRSTGRPAAGAQSQAARAAADHPAGAGKDAVAEAIRAAESDLEKDLDIASEIELAAQMQAAKPAPAPQPGFQPNSRLFANEAGVAPQPAAATSPRPAMNTAQAATPHPAQAAPEMRMEPRTTQMPRVEDFPPVVKAEIEHRAAPQGHAEDRGPMGLLKRISSSLGRRDEDEVNHAAQAAPAPQARRPLSPEASVYAPRRGTLDDQGRVTPATRATHEDEQLEIPAFLRRQAK
ncbi:cell division protein FtsZ [Hoeflea sp. YIM 152468]|uniref:cell division protein FtsZ n=1 Tax=Hoeflea sp. YIM 152468 TaxID=3031759 RepID=UPI0023DACE6F|nr:cell division protein FtsZ [Hoeflea sp. YIM 152468]MDF1609561.1 cell division protein FtsZ [Hoeflea sp. YIM 152468]